MSPPRAKDFHQGDTDHDDAVGAWRRPRLPWDTRLAGAVYERKSRRNPHSRVGASFAIDGFARGVTNGPETPGGGRTCMGRSASPQVRGCASRQRHLGIPPDCGWPQSSRCDDKTSHPASRASWAQGNACQPRAEGTSLNDPYHLIDARSGILTARPHMGFSDRMGSQAGRLFHGRTPWHAS